MTIGVANPYAAYLERQLEIDAAVKRVFSSGQYILGSEVEAFEKEFVEWQNGGKGAFLGVGNGTDAIEVVLRALDLQAGVSVVFTVSHTAVATVAAIERAGLVPVLVDIAEDGYSMDPQALENTIRFIKRTKPNLRPTVVLPVHIYGRPAPMEEINAVAQLYGLTVLEDCAQAHGAVYKGQKVGTWSKAGTFSFYPTKNLGALGDAGGIFSNDDTLISNCRVLSQYGWKVRYLSAVPGINSRIDPVQAAILKIKLAYLDDDNRRRRKIAEVYGKELGGLDMLLPKTGSDLEHVYHLYVVRLRKRDEFLSFMKERGIACARHYIQPIHMQEAYRERILAAPEGLPVTEKIYREIVSLPMYPQLSERDLEHVCLSIRAFMGES